MGNGFSPLHKAVDQNDIGALRLEIQRHGSCIDQQEDEVMIFVESGRHNSKSGMSTVESALNR